MTLCIVLFIACCAGQFIFAGAETGFVTWNALKVSHAAAQGSVRARWGVFLIEHRDALLAAVLIWTSVCIAGATLAFGDIYRGIEAALPAGFGAVRSPESWFLTPLLVVFCEMLPKSLFRIYSFRMTLRAVPLLMAAYVLSWPVSWAFSKALTALHRTPADLGSYHAKKREEMVLVAMEGARRGTLFEGIGVPIKAILDMQGRTLSEIARREDIGPEHVLEIADGTTVADVRTWLAGRDADEIVLRSKLDGTFVGWIHVLDLIGTVSSFEVRRLARPMPSLASTVSAVSCLLAGAAGYCRFVATGDDGAAQAVVDRVRLSGLVFRGTSVGPGFAEGARIA